MTATDERLTELRQQLSEAVKRLGELEVASVEAMIEGKVERDISAIEVRKGQARDRVALLTRAIKQLECQQQLADQQRMLDQTMATISPLVAPLDRAAAALALPPYTPAKPPQLEPETNKAKQVGRWFGTPRQSAGRWNERLR
jgi:hypothetical protein